jgi:predicted O-methyltransferase YrrM
MGKMIEDLEGYFGDLVPGRDELLLRLEQEAREEGIPIVGPTVGHLLYLLVRVIQGRNVLELGAAGGYSAIFLGEACRENGGRLVTLEWDPRMAARAKVNLQQAGLSLLVDVRVGSALELMESMEGPYDLVFMDLDKEYYLPALSSCQRLLRPGGLLIVDNVGFRGAEPFNKKISSDPDWLAIPLLAFLPGHSPEKDGLMIALRR